MSPDGLELAFITYFTFVFLVLGIKWQHLCILPSNIVPSGVPTPYLFRDFYLIKSSMQFGGVEFNMHHLGCIYLCLQKHISCWLKWYFEIKNKREALNSLKKRVKVSKQCYWDTVFSFLTPLIHMDWFTPNLGTMYGSVTEVFRLAYDSFYNT